ncbi:MAG: hypothetical protein H6709_19425 [Kofleriaceae bacterium]|nr:hypothetical protein [Myxococcales bacterium]MCB9559446.1 hypothetical protein [Kofleriaceae bacterium]MCB9574257.1 hypothetical protein [Kofleriaceae bacterium]
MSKLVVGTVRRNDLAGGQWILDAEDGQQYQLRGEVAGLADGIKAKVEGKLQKDVMSIGMAGPILEVAKVTKL